MGGDGDNHRSKWRKTSKIVTVSMSEEELNLLNSFVNIGMAPSRSELVRFCILHSCEYLQQMAKKQTKIIGRSQLSPAGKRKKHLPETIYIKNGGVKYSKYVKEEYNLYD